MAEKKKYAQMLRILYMATEMAPIILQIGFMDADLDNNREATVWCVLMEPNTLAHEFMYGIGATLKVMEDREIHASYTTLLFALQTNRFDIKSTIESFNAAESEFKILLKVFNHSVSLMTQVIE